jgi:hypothetical protein
MVYKFASADVAILIRNRPSGFVPVSRAIIGIRKIWLPTETIAKRLERLRQLALPHPEHWHCRRWEAGELGINDAIAEKEFSWEAFAQSAANSS